MAALEGAETRWVAKAIAPFVVDPNHPSLNLHPLGSDPSRRLHSFRASDDLRVLVAKQDNVHMLIEVGHDDAVYERAARQRFVANVHTGFVDLALEQQGSGRAPLRQLSRTVPEDRPGVVDHWTGAELRAAGLADDAIRLVRGRSEDELLDLDLDDEALSLIIDLSEMTPEQWRAPALDPTVEAEVRIRQAITEFGALSGISPFFPPEVVAELAAGADRGVDGLSPPRPTCGRRPPRRGPGTRARIRWDGQDGGRSPPGRRPGGRRSLISGGPCAPSASMPSTRCCAISTFSSTPVAPSA